MQSFSSISTLQSIAQRSINLKCNFILMLTMVITQQQCNPVLATNEISSSVTTAFTPIFNPSSKTRRAPISISDELGTSPTFQYRLFDPLNLATEENFAQYREAELKHGRIAMLAVLGNVLPGLSSIRQEEGWSVIAPPQSPLLLSVSQDIAFQDVPIGIKAISVVPKVGWLQIIVAVGFLETMVFVQRSQKDMPGDYGVGYFGLRDKGLHERPLQSELENGRLAMIAFLAQILIELLTGQTPVDQIQFMLPLFRETTNIYTNYIGNL